MEPQASGAEQRLDRLEAQIDRLNLALDRWRDAQEHQQPLERRLTELTDQCADIVRQWSSTGERHTHAISELEASLSGWNDVEARLQRDATRRFESLERTIENEWASLRNLHEEPARELRAHADSRMNDTVTVRRITGYDEDPMTGVSTPTYADVYAGSCRVKIRDVQPHESDSAGSAVVVQARELHLPWESPELLPGDVAFMAADTYTPRLRGAVFRVDGTHEASDTTAQRVPVTRVGV